MKRNQASNTNDYMVFFRRHMKKMPNKKKSNYPQRIGLMKKTPQQPTNSKKAFRHWCFFFFLGSNVSLNSFSLFSLHSWKNIVIGLRLRGVLPYMEFLEFLSGEKSSVKKIGERKLKFNFPSKKKRYQS